MGKKSKQSMINIKPLVLKGSKDLIQGIASSMEGIQATKVIQTYVLENSNLKLTVGKDGKAIFSGVVKWIGNRTDGSKGTVLCVQKGQKDQGELKLVMPTEDTVQKIGLDPVHGLIKIVSKETVKCSVCGKGIRIFDEVLSCPLCNSKAHADHLMEWINMRHSCPICKKALAVDSENNPIPIE